VGEAESQRLCSSQPAAKFFQMKENKELQLRATNNKKYGGRPKQTGYFSHAFLPILQ